MIRWVSQRGVAESAMGGSRQKRAGRLSLCAAFALGLDRGHRVADRLHPAAGDQVAPGLAESPKVGAELTAVAEPGPLGGLVEAEGLDHVRHRAAEQPEAHPTRRLQGDGLDGDSCQTGSDSAAVRGEHHLTSAFEDLDFLTHGPRLSIGVRSGSGGEDSLAGCSNVEVEGGRGRVRRPMPKSRVSLPVTTPMYAPVAAAPAREAQLVATSSRFMPEASRRCRARL